MTDRELEKIEKIIESCHVNFLIGSGASRNYLDTLWNIEELLTSLDNEEESEEKKLLETSIKEWYFKKCIFGNIGLLHNKIIPRNKKKDFNETYENYQRLINSLNTILLKRKTNLLSKQINLFTTNMDIFLDFVLDKNNVEYNDGFSGKFESYFASSNYKKAIYKNSQQYDIQSELPLFNLFKLHGSLTWKYKNTDNNLIIYDSKLISLIKLSKIKFVEEELVQIDSDKTFDDLLAKSESILPNIELNYGLDKHKAFLSEYDNLIMINPTKEKFASTTLKLNYYEQFRMYSNCLEKENSVLFVTGFSFADEHIRDITLRCANVNPTLIIYVFCFNENEKDKIETYFNGLQFNNVICLHDYTFEYMISKVFGKIALKLDDKFYNLRAESETNKEENGVSS